MGSLRGGGSPCENHIETGLKTGLAYDNRDLFLAIYPVQYQYRDLFLSVWRVLFYIQRPVSINKTCLYYLLKKKQILLIKIVSSTNPDFKFHFPDSIFQFSIYIFQVAIPRFQFQAMHKHNFWSMNCQIHPTFHKFN